MTCVRFDLNGRIYPLQHLIACSLFQIGAYDQQIWEKSIEQTQIKVN